MLRRNNVHWLDVASHVPSFNQSEWIISACYRYSKVYLWHQVWSFYRHPINWVVHFCYIISIIYRKISDLPLLRVLNSVWAESFSSNLDKLFSSTKGDALMFFALTVTLYVVLGVKEVLWNRPSLPWCIKKFLRPFSRHLQMADLACYPRPISRHTQVVAAELLRTWI